MRVILAYILIVIWSSASSQTFLPIHYDTTEITQAVEWRGYGFYHTSALRNELTQKFIQGGMITEEIKDNSREKQDLFNRGGGDVSTEVTYFKGSQDDEKLGWWVRLGSYNQMAFEYAGDAYDLLLYGNQAFLKRTANFSNTDFLLMQYDKIGVGVFNPKTKNSIGLNAVFVNDYQRMRIPRGSLYTSEETGMIDLDVIAYYQKASAHTHFQGMGAAVDFDYHVPIKPGGYMEGFIHVMGRNLGAAYLNELTEQSVNGSVQLDGFSFEQFNDFQDGNWSTDAYLDSLNYEQREGHKWVALPGFAQVGKTVDKTNDRKWQSFFGARMYASIAYLPMVYVGGHYRLNPQGFMGGQLSYGGFGRIRLGYYAGYQWGNMDIGLGTEDLLGVFTQTQFGKSVLLRFAWNLAKDE